MSAPIVLANMIWVPRTNLSMQAVRHNFTPRFYEERGCKPCEHRSYRFDEEFCGACPNYKGSVKLYANREVGGVDYVGLPIGFTKSELIDMAGIKKRAFKRPPLDKRPTPKMKRKIKFTGKLFDYQKPAVKAWLARRWGMLTAPPRTGKTAMCIYITCEIGMKTIILANQRDLLVQFMQDFDKLTDHNEASERAGRPLVGIVKKDEDFFKYEIALATYQRLARSAKRMKAVRSHYGLAVVDEAHRASAEGFGGVLNAFNTRYKLPVTATPKRKDGRHCLPYNAKITTDTGEACIGDVVTGKHAANAVLSYNHVTHKQEMRSILARHANGQSEAGVKVAYESGTLGCTADHEVWSVTRGCYVRADSLVPGETIEVTD